MLEFFMPLHPPTATLIIHKRLPGLNEYIAAERTNKYKAAGMKRDAETLIGLCARQQLHGIHFAGRVTMRYTWREPNRKRDKDNIAFARKFIQDALVKIGVLQGDGWDWVDGFSDSFEVDQENPGVTIVITEVEL